jgi:hypothetical protein
MYDELPRVVHGVERRRVAGEVGQHVLQEARECAVFFSTTALGIDGSMHPDKQRGAVRRLSIHESVGEVIELPA